MFGSNFSTKESQSFYNYYKDISKKVKERKIDILLVVNMYLTGFDCPTLNTMYVDKNLRYHGLIQAYSRTNRILNEQKSQGNIVVFRNLKKNTDEAITLFSNKEAIEEIIIQPYSEYVKVFNETFLELMQITPTINSVNDLLSEEDELKFIKAFRKLMRLLNVLVTFADFKWEDLSMNEQLYNDFKSKYLDLWQKVKVDNQVEKVSILEDVDFELELLHRDEINVAYILKLLANLKDAKDSEKENLRKSIMDLLSGEAHLRSKRELIERFILENLPIIEDSDNIPEEFEKYWNAEQEKAFDKLVKEENLIPEKTTKLIENYLFAERKPIRDEALALIDGEQPSVLVRKSLGDRIIKRIVEFVETFVNGRGV